MANVAIVFSVIYAIFVSSSQCTPTAAPPPVQQKKCSYQDSVCLTDQARMVYKSFIRGDPELGIEQLDKVKIDLVTIKTDGLVYDIRNLDVDGLKDAVIKNVSVHTDLKNIAISFKTSLTIKGEYGAGGRLYAVPVCGNGPATINMTDIYFYIVSFYDITKNKDCQDVLILTENVYSYTVKGGAHYLFENAYNGDKEKSDKLHGLLNRNWRIIVSRFGDYYFEIIINKILTNINKYLYSKPLKDLVIL